MKREKKSKKENEKVANRKLRKVGNLETLGKIIPSFLFSKFSKYCAFNTSTSSTNKRYSSFSKKVFVLFVIKTPRNY